MLYLLCSSVQIGFGSFFIQLSLITTILITDNKLLVHCHAGIGRTGVLIALDCAIYELKNAGTVNIKNLIETIRKQRPRAVMNRWQYAYINVVVAEQAYQMGLLEERTSSGHITRQLINEVWLDLEDDMNRNFENELPPSSKLREKNDANIPINNTVLS
ncbi:unnamed protein product [Gongylonema pulchrum]|uniref:TYR_PHOSPHATASE_2 domain-containing protein n=1 Tax=Gongylonema pulchrum TaxID=637853 RepID=A0A183E160_9BILA|nr:unnamed protein product [Gongylonema pulchrum]